MKFEIKGSFRLKRKVQPFCISVDAANEAKAMEKVYGMLGGNYQCKRRFVKGVSIAKK